MEKILNSIYAKHRDLLAPISKELTTRLAAARVIETRRQTYADQVGAAQDEVRAVQQQLDSALDRFVISNEVADRNAADAANEKISAAQTKLSQLEQLQFAAERAADPTQLEISRLQEKLAQARRAAGAEITTAIFSQASNQLADNLALAWTAKFILGDPFGYGPVDPAGALQRLLMDCFETDVLSRVPLQNKQLNADLGLI